MSHRSHSRGSRNPCIFLFASLPPSQLSMLKASQKDRQPLLYSSVVLSLPLSLPLLYLYVYFSFYLKWSPAPGQCGSLGGSIVSQTERSWVLFQVRAHAYIAGSVPVWGTYEGNQSMFLSLIVVLLPLSLSPFPSLSMSLGEDLKNIKIATWSFQVQQIPGKYGRSRSSRDDKVAETMPGMEGSSMYSLTHTDTL